MVSLIDLYGWYQDVKLSATCGLPIVIAACAGYEITTEGDAFVLVKRTAADSIRACVYVVSFDNS